MRVLWEQREGESGLRINPNIYTKILHFLLWSIINKGNLWSLEKPDRPQIEWLVNFQALPGGYRSSGSVLGKQGGGSFYRHGTPKQINSTDKGAEVWLHTLPAMEALRSLDTTRLQIEATVSASSTFVPAIPWATVCRMHQDLCRTDLPQI